MVVDDEAHIGLVNAHAEGVGSHHDRLPVELEVVLILPPLLLVQPSVIPSGGDALGAQVLAEAFHGRTGGAVDDATLVLPLLDEPEQDVFRLGRRTSKNRLGRSNPVTMRKGSRSSNRRTMSSCTSPVAVAVKAATTGCLGRRWTKAAMLK